jgi:hypothetical protein
VTHLVLIYESVTSSASIVRLLTLHSWTLNSLPNAEWRIIELSWTELNSRTTALLRISQSQVKVTLRLRVSQSVSLGVQPHLGLMTRYLLPFDSYGLVFVGRVYLLYMLLAVSSAVFLGSESLGTCDHILLPQIWDFTFRRLPQLAGSRWRYSTPPPHRILADNSESVSCITMDGQWTSLSWNKAPIWGLRPDLYYCHLLFCWCGALSLTRGRVCSLQFPVVIASAVILGSESRGTRDLTLLSPIRDFPFRRLLRLAGLRWRHSTPPPHGLLYCHKKLAHYVASARTSYKASLPTVPLLLWAQVAKRWVWYCYMFTKLLSSNDFLPSPLF